MTDKQYEAGITREDFIGMLDESEGWMEFEHPAHRGSTGYKTSYQWCERRDGGIRFYVNVSVYDMHEVIGDEFPYQWGIEIDAQYDMKTGPDPDEGDVFDISLHWSRHTPQQVIDFHNHLWEQMPCDYTA